MTRVKFNRFKGVRKRRFKSKAATQKAIEDVVRPDQSCDGDDNTTASNSSNPGVVPGISAASKKMELLDTTINKLLEKLPTPEQEKEDNCFLLTQKSALNNLIKHLCCPLCKLDGLVFNTHIGMDMGFASKGYIFCNNCTEIIDEGYLSEKVGGSTSPNVPFEVNIRSVFAFRGVGCGYSSMKDWSKMMNIPNCLSKSSYQSGKKVLDKGSEETFSQVTAKSVEAIRNKYAEIGQMPDQDNIVNIAVSYDGSWQKRGHSSHIGVGIVIDLLTGLPIDYEVLCNFCHQCLKAPKDDDPNYDEWIANHKANCSKNYSGSANSMEQEIAKRIWGRSETKNHLRYTTMLSDGDSKAYDLLVESKVYGDIQITKEECVNHVSKRMGTALNNLTQQCKAQKNSIGGKGKLTKEKIIKIQNYYGRAIKDNAGDRILMKKRIFAILYHMSSTDTNPKHVHCPPGDKSWCFWQRAIAKEEQPGPHKEHETVPVEVGQQLVPIFQRLTEERLLMRCNRNRTQNPNESIHSIIWRYCPKITFVGRKTLETAVSLAICQFSVGSTFHEALCRCMGIEPGAHLVKGAIDKSIERIKKAEKASTKEAKTQRRKLKFSKLTKQTKAKKCEGETYKAGSFL